MPRLATVIAVAVLIAGTVVAVLFFYYNPEPEPGRAKVAGLEERDRVERFVARFDSLTDARLYPTVWRSGTFLKTRFNDVRDRWTLTVSSGDWDRRNEDSKRDLLAMLYSAFKGVRAQAGGDPEEAVLIIVDEDGKTLAEVSGKSGAVIER
jgi:hypothetical protein